MASLNKVFLIGNLTRDPELRYTPAGVAVANLGVAVNRRFKDKSGELKEEVCFLTVTVWDKQAEACCQYLQKGRPIFCGRCSTVPQLGNQRRAKAQHDRYSCRARAVFRDIQKFGNHRRECGGRGRIRNECRRGRHDSS